MNTEKSKKNLQERVQELQVLFKQEGVSEAAQKATIRLLMHLMKEYADLGVKYMELVNVLVKEGEKDEEWEENQVG